MLARIAKHWVEARRSVIRRLTVESQDALFLPRRLVDVLFGKGSRRWREKRSDEDISEVIMRLALLTLLFIPLAACASGTSTNLPLEARSLSGHLSKLERQHLDAIAYIHGGRSIIQRARESGALADNVEWWVSGPSEILPFAGTWRGLEGVARFHKKLSETMRYDKVELQRYMVSGDDVAAIFLGEGVARATGKPFRSEIIRLYTFADGKVVRVRNYYDTAAYIKAVRGL